MKHHITKRINKFWRGKSWKWEKHFKTQWYKIIFKQKEID